MKPGAVRSAARDGGFTLLEVLVSLAILGVSLAAILGILAQNLALVHDARREAEARALLQSLMSETSVHSPLTAGQNSGKTATGIAWHVSIRAYGSTENPPAFVIEADASWPKAGREVNLTLKTLRLDPGTAP